MHGVNKGVAWLDNNIVNWWTYIDVAKLNMNDATKCVLAQIGNKVGVGDYLDMRDKFCLQDCAVEYKLTNNSQADQEMWRDIITERQRLINNPCGEINFLTDEPSNNVPVQEALKHIELDIARTIQRLSALDISDHGIPSILYELEDAERKLKNVTDRQVVKAFRGE